MTRGIYFRKLLVQRPIYDRNGESGLMRQKYRWLFRTIAILLALGIVISLSASAFIGSDWARQYLLHKVETASGRQWRAEKLTLRLTPALRIDATQLHVSNPDWVTATPDFLYAESASLKIALLPLLIGRVRVENAELAGAQLFLTRNATTDNWHFLSATKNAAGGAEVSGRPDAGAKSLSFLPDRLSARQTVVQYRSGDGKTRRWQLPSLTLNASAGRKVQVDMQVLADELAKAPAEVQPEAPADGRIVHVVAGADNLSDFGQGAVTPFSVNADVPGQNAAGSIHADGALGLGPNLAGTDLRVHIDAPAKSPWQTLAGFAGRKLAAIKLDFSLHSKAKTDSMEITQLAFALGDLHVSGQGVVHTGQKPLRIEGQLRTDYLDWAKMTQDAGLPQPPEKAPGAMFRDIPLAWPMLERVNGFTADLGLQLSVLKLRSGVPLQNVKMQAHLQPDQLRVPAFSAGFLGGATTADALFTAHDRQVKLNLKASGVSIEQWRTLLHKPLLLSGGPLGVNASVRANGISMNQLAATMSGPVSLSMGRAVVRSSRASEAESLLTGLVPALAGKRADHMDVVCIVASLPFQNGRATAASIAGARTESSQLLTDGAVDLRDQTLDLHGRVTGVNGIQLGASMLVGDVNISGKLVKPRFRIDTRGMLGTAARVGAAILSIGLTAVGQTLWDANADDACKVAGQSPGSKAPAGGELAVPQPR
jgi:uncharacterized protein involved in outer membrane biogenesis